MSAGFVFTFSDIVHAVASIPDSLSIWFYGDKRHEVGTAFGCLVRVGDLCSGPTVKPETGGGGNNGEFGSSRVTETRS